MEVVYIDIGVLSFHSEKWFLKFLDPSFVNWHNMLQVHFLKFLYILSTKFNLPFNQFSSQEL